MAESAVAFFLGKLDELLTNESSLIFGVRDEIRSLHDELEWIRSFLKDADKKSRENERAKTWVGQLRREVYVAENIIDDFVLQTHNKKHHRLNFFTIRRIFRPFTQYKSLRSHGTEIREIQKKLKEISDNKSKYGVEDIIQGGHDDEASSSSHPRRERLTTNFMEETDVVGFEDDVSSIVEKLMASERRRVVISIVGMGGLGKTTLAKKVYNKVKGNFNCHAWISVSQEYNVRALILNLNHTLMFLSRDEMAMVDKIDTENLKLKLCEHLKEKQYLIVVDDIWSMEGWNDLLPVLPNYSKKRSRVVLTTRKKEVALHADALSVPHELKFLPEEECWELFCKKAFPGNAKVSCPLELESWGRKIVAKCGGLPLAIVVLGGLLSRKEKLPNEWEKVCKSMNWQLQKGEENISGILGLSYNDLPYYLKYCFLYCGVFPEDFEIRIWKLIRLWIAEGFIERRGDETVEEVAEDYLGELIQRNMIQVAKKSCNGGVKACRVHDLLRELAIFEAKESKFFEISVPNESLFSELFRRLVVYRDTPRESTLPFSHLRTLLNFANGDYPKAYFKNVLCNAKHLRVLDLEGVNLSYNYLPHQIGKLIHLRYLGLRKTQLKKVPSSIGNLFNLHTLDIRGTNNITLPKNLSNLRALRHLCMEFPDVGNFNMIPFIISVAFPKNVNLQNLRNLETLTGIAAGKWISSSLEMLTNLRHLGIGNIFSVHVDGLANSLSKLDHLHSLCLEGDAIPMLNLGAHHSLYKMTLYGHLKSLPILGDFKKSNLTKLCLYLSKLKEDPFPVLKELPKLKILRLLDYSYLGDTMHCMEGGFLELKELKLFGLFKLEHWVVDSGAFPSLRSLTFSRCYGLKKLPETIATMTSLQELQLLQMPRTFIDSLQENHDSGEYQKIKNIPSVVIL